MKKTQFLDTTLRDGEQTPGVAFTPEQKIDLAKMLDAIGVDIIEAGIPAMGGEELKTVSAILDLGLSAKILTWNRLCLQDIKASIACGAKAIHIAAPVSDPANRKENKQIARMGDERNAKSGNLLHQS